MVADKYLTAFLDFIRRRRDKFRRTPPDPREHPVGVREDNNIVVDLWIVHKGNQEGQIKCKCDYIAYITMHLR